MHTEGGDKKYGKQGTEAKTCIAADAEDTHSFSPVSLGYAIYAAGGFRVENGGSNAHDGDGCEYEPVVCHKAGQCQGSTCKENTQCHEPLPWALIRQPAEKGLDNGAQEGGGKHEPCSGGVVHAVEIHKKWQQRRQGTGVDIVGQMACCQ